MFCLLNFDSSPLSASLFHPLSISILSLFGFSKLFPVCFLYNFIILLVKAPWYQCQTRVIFTILSFQKNLLIFKTFLASVSTLSFYFDALWCSLLLFKKKKLVKFKPLSKPHLSSHFTNKKPTQRGKEARRIKYLTTLKSFDSCLSAWERFYIIFFHIVLFLRSCGKLV